MLRQSGFLKTLLKAAAVGDVIIFLGSYGVWHQMNTSRGNSPFLDCMY